MIYDRARVGDLVIWNKKAILDNLDDMASGTTWEHEELDCYMTIVNKRNDALGAQCELQCVNDCGLHLRYSITREEYEEIYDEIREDPFLFASSLQDIGDLYSPPDMKRKYDFSTDSVEILRQVISGTLPAHRNATHRYRKGK